MAPQHDDADEQADVAGFGRPEGLDCRARRFRLLVPEANQQIGAESDQLPADEELHQVRREHQPHHREREKRLVGVVPSEPRWRLLAQVSQGIELNEQRDQCDEHEHHRGGFVDQDADGGEWLPLGRQPVPRETRGGTVVASPPGDRCSQGTGGAENRQPGSGPAGSPERHGESQDQKRRCRKQERRERESAGVRHHPFRRSR